MVLNRWQLPGLLIGLFDWVRRSLGGQAAASQAETASVDEGLAPTAVCRCGPDASSASFAAVDWHDAGHVCGTPSIGGCRPGPAGTADVTVAQLAAPSIAAAPAPAASPDSVDRNVVLS